MGEILSTKITILNDSEMSTLNSFVKNINRKNVQTKKP